MAISVSDHASNSNEQLVHAAEVLASSTGLRRIFKAIYSGRKETKTAGEVSNLTGDTQKIVLTHGLRLARLQLVEQTTIDGRVAYSKVPHYAANRDRIMRLAERPESISKVPTKRNTGTVTARESPIKVKLTILPQAHRAARLSIDEVDSFAAVRPVKSRTAVASGYSEDDIKRGFAGVMEEFGTFKDWGGEVNDLFTSHAVLHGRRVAAAMAFKGPGVKGKLTPGKMGANGDQLQRLFSATADLFVVQYVGEIAQSVHEQVHQLAVAKSALTGAEVWYCVVDGSDTQRLADAYPTEFLASTSRAEKL